MKWRGLVSLNWFTGLIMGLGVLCFFSPFSDLDFTWQIRTGEQILRTGQIRTTDEFTYTIHGQPVHDFEWLYEVILYLLWQTLGTAGLRLLKTALVLAPVILVARHLHRDSIPPQWAALAAGLTALFLYPAWNLRPMACTTIGMLWATIHLHNHCWRRKPLPWWLPLILLGWANLHPGVIVGQGLLLGAIGWEWINHWLRWNPALDRKALHRLTLIGGLAFLATLLSPDPVERFLYPFRPELRHPIHRIFAEMLPLHAVLPAAPGIVFGSYFLALAVLAVIVIRFREFRLWELALLAGLGMLASFAVRSLPDWIWCLVLLGMPPLGKMLRFAAVEKSVALQLRWPWLALIAAGCVAGSILALGWQPFPPIAGVVCPEPAAQFIREKGLKGNFFAPPNYGAYLGWRLPDSAKVYVDTRGFYFPPELLSDSHNLPQMTPGWEARLRRVLQEYRTDYFLLESTGPRGELWRQLQARKIIPLYADDDAVLLSADQVWQALRPAP